MMSQEDNERPRWGDAAVRVSTCTARGGAGEAKGSWDGGGLHVMEGLQASSLKVHFFLIQTDLISEEDMLQDD